MLTASMITYWVDEDKKTVTATVTGTENDALECMRKCMRRVNLPVNFVTTCSLYKLPDKFTAKAKYDPNDPNPFSIERGKEIARRRLYDKYNKALDTALNAAILNIRYATETAEFTLAITRDRINRFKYYEHYCVKQAHLHQNDAEKSEN